jgi:energy-coupling factor transporter ATP-binding protein EcfA2
MSDILRILTIGIDFDGTFAADPEMFREIVLRMRQRGHKVIMVTQRCSEFSDQVESVVQMDDLSIIYASGKSKEEAARLYGFIVDIWIDDAPYSVSTALKYRGCP